MQPSVFYVPSQMPPEVARRLAEHFGIEPGDAILQFPGERPPLTLQRDFDGAEAAELRAIMRRLIREQGPSPRRRAPSSQQLRVSGDHYPRLEP